MTRMWTALLLVASLFLFDGSASAHTQSYGYLTADLTSASSGGRLELAVTDADTLLDLDGNGDGRITWGEVRAREQEIAATLLSQVSIGSAGRACRLAGQPMATATHGGETYLVIPFTASCPTLAGDIDVGYRLMFAADAQHRGLVVLTTADGTQSLVMTPEADHVSVAAGGGGADLFLTFIRHGIHHILVSYDHILFVITLLLGTVVFNGASGTAGLGRLLGDAARVVTAFTLAHSVTLALAAFQLLRIPPPLTESLIAVTIALSAANNLWPVVTRRLWLVALGFGLIHGVGFANVLAELDLPRGSLLAALLSFNIGVELGQLCIVAAGLPLLYAVGRMPALGRLALPASSFAIILIGGAWFADRAFGFALMPF